jgi:hypothetical protein
VTERLCRWCRKQIGQEARIDAEWCSKVCRQAAFRARRKFSERRIIDDASPETRVYGDTSPGADEQASPETRHEASPETRHEASPETRHEPSPGDGEHPSPRSSTTRRTPGDLDRRVRLQRKRLAGRSPAVASLRLAYADPPYPGLAHLYRGHQDYAGEVDHDALVARLLGFDGWALSTSEDALRDVLSLTPRGTHVCPWTKPHGAALARGPSSVHEYVLVWPARLEMPGVRDALYASVARGGDSDLIGRKPMAFCAWLFALLGASPLDSFDDLFPGSGAVGRHWEEFRRSGTELTCRPTLEEKRRQMASNALETVGAP